MKRAEATRVPLWIFPIVAVTLVAGWQWATVTANYGGNWTALFCTGALQPHPPLVESEHVYVFPDSTGYDSQEYHYIAHDPFMRSDVKSYLDDARLRYRRILIPLLAYGAAMGRAEWVDTAYELVCLLSIGLGVYWSCRIVQQAGLSAAWGLLFLLTPAIPIAMDRLVVDAGLAALTAAFLYYSRSPSWKLFLVLACAALTRETGILLILAYCAYLLWRREVRIAAIFVLSAIPTAAWYFYVQSRTEGKPYGLSLIPLSAIVRVLKAPWQYPAGTPMVAAVRAADYLALAGVLLAFGLSLYGLLRGPFEPPRIAAALFAVMGLMLQRTDHWQNVYDFGRVYTPLLLCLAAVAAQYRKPWLLASIGMILPRVAIQLTPQFLGIVRWIA